MLDGATIHPHRGEDGKQICLSRMKQIIAAILIVVAVVAVAQDREPKTYREWIDHLGKNYGERVEGHGIMANDVLISLLISPSNTWTILGGHKAAEVATPIAAGTDWQYAPHRACLTWPASYR